MGLFNRLFGKKRQEEKSTTDSIEEAAEQEVTCLLYTSRCV